MRRFLVGAATLTVFVACDALRRDETVDAEPTVARQEPSSTTPLAPAVLGATDFCKLVFEAPKRLLEKRCSAAEVTTPRFGLVTARVRDNVEMCWSMLHHGVESKRLTLPAVSAKRCAEALEKLPWEEALDRPLAATPECRNLTIGLSTVGKPCRSSPECSHGLFCSGAQTDADGICSKQAADSNTCALPPWRLFGELEAACEGGLFCDHGGGERASLVPPAPVEVPSAAPWGEIVPFGPEGFGEPRKRVTVKPGPSTVSGRLPPEVIQRIVRANLGRIRVCYEAGLKKNPSLAGRVTVRFVIGADGSVSTASAKSDLSEPLVESCVTRAFQTLTFPKPEGGIVSVSYPLVFSPDGATPSPWGGERDDAEPAPPPTPALGAPTETCLALRKEGEACRAARECGSKLACVMGSCGKALAAGATCRRDRDCDAGLRCLAPTPSAEVPEDGAGENERPAPTTTATCAAPRSAGEACSSDHECLGSCVAGKCAAFCGAG